MALDPGIILQLQNYQAPDFARAQQQAMTIGNLMQQREMGALYKQAQIEQMKSQVDERGLKVSAAKAAALRDQAIREWMAKRNQPQGMQAPLDPRGRDGGVDQRGMIQAMPGGQGEAGSAVPQAGPGMRVRTPLMSPEMQQQVAPQGIGQQGGIPPEVVYAMQQQGLKPDQIEQFANSHRLGQSKVKGWQEIAGPNGEPMAAQYDEYGQMVGKPVPKAVAMQMFDRGGSQQAWNQYTGQLGGSYAKSATPDGLMTDARGKQSNAIAAGNLGVAKGNLAVNQGRLELDRTAPKLAPLDTSQGPMLINQRTGEAVPVMSGGKALPPKEGEGAKKERLANENSLAQLDESLKLLDKHPKAFGMAQGIATAQGGALGSGFVGWKAGEEGAQARAFVFSKAAALGHELLGAAQTPSEQGRIKSFLPQETDSADVIKNKLKGLMKEAKIKQQVYGGGDTKPPAQDDPLGLRK